MPDFILALDQGTTSSRAILFNHSDYFTHSASVRDWGFPHGGPRAHFGGTAYAHGGAGYGRGGAGYDRGPNGWYHAGGRWDRNGNGVPDRYEHRADNRPMGDRDHDGVPNAYDSHPGNPYRR